MSFLENEIFVRGLMSLLGVSGFFVARLISNHKIKKRPLVCPAGFDCHAVVHSDYSKFLNIRVEVLGMLYYALIAISYFISIFFSGSLPDIFVALVAVSSLGAFVFSGYLIWVQIFVLKKGCSWCFVSASISVAIFVLTVYAQDLGLITQVFLK